MSFSLFLFTFLSIMYAYVGFRTITHLKSGMLFKLILWMGLLISALLPPATILLRTNGIESFRAELVAWAGYVGMGFLTVAFSLLLARDILFFLFWAGNRLTGLFKKKTARDSGRPMNPDRRLFLLRTTNMAILGAAGVGSIWGFVLATKTPEVREVTVILTDLPPSLENLTIVQISDIHVGPTVKKGFIRRVAERVNQLRPDLIVLTGDLVDGSVPYLKEDVSPLADLSAPLGKFFVTGNHEYYSGVLPWIAEMERLGFRVLINEHKLIRRGSGRLLLAGVTDYRAGNRIPGHKSSPKKAMEGAPPSDLKILLAHQPESIYEAAEQGVDFQISGHLHGGQYFPGNLVYAALKPFVSGLHTHKNTRLYVSRGTGYWGPPLRTGIPSEITLIRITSSPKK